MIERERKFLVKELVGLGQGDPGVYIEQAYLCAMDVAVRVRIYNRDQKAELHVKWQSTVSEDTPHLARNEIHLPIKDIEKARELFAPSIGVVRKIRLRDDFWEFDHFRGDLVPLLVAEIELPEHLDEWPEELPDPTNHKLELGPEVTHNVDYRNDQLAKNGLPQHFIDWFGGDIDA